MRKPESDYYSFEHKGVHFIGLCNVINRDHIGHLCSDQIISRGQCEWLEQELSKNEMPKIIFSHIPIEPDGQDKKMFLSRNDSRYLRALTAEGLAIKEVITGVTSLHLWRFFEARGDFGVYLSGIGGKMR